MPYVAGDFLRDVMLMQKGQLYFVECETNKIFTWDLCVVRTAADKRQAEHLRSANCDFVKADGTTAQRQRRQCLHVQHSRP